MSILDQNDLLILHNYVQNNHYRMALHFIKTLLPHTTDDRLTLLHIFVLTELDLFTEAEEMFSNVKNVLPYFLPKICKNMNLIKNLKNMAKTDKDIYEACILEGDTHTANKYAVKMLPENKNFLLFVALYNSLRNCNGNELRITMNGVLKNEGINPGLLTMIVQRGLMGGEVVKYLDNVKGTNGDYLILVKELLCRDFLSAKTMRQILDKLNLISTINDNQVKSVLVNYLLNKVDDWNIYLYAIKNGIYIEESESVNYRHYKVLKENAFENLEKLIGRVTSFPEILEIIETMGNKYDPIDEQYSYIFRYLKNDGTITMDDLKRVYFLYYKNKTILGFKLLMALLLSTRQEKYILLAFKIAKEEQNDINYEFRLIYMFIARFFCHLSEFKGAYGEFDIKNILLPKMYGVWNRLHMKVGNDAIVRDHKLIIDNVYTTMEEFFLPFLHYHKTFKKSTIKSINTTVIFFIEAGLHFQAIELLELRKSLCDENFEANECTNNFINTLGEGCRFIFSDTQMDEDAIQGFMLPNMYNWMRDRRFDTEIFNNDVENITCPIFHNFIKELYGMYR